MNAVDGVCKVQLDLEVNMEPRVVTVPQSDGADAVVESRSEDTWREKNSVLEQVLSQVGKITDFRQDEF